MSLDLKTSLAQWRREAPLPFPPEAMAWVFQGLRQVHAQVAKANQAESNEVRAESLVSHLRLRAQNQFGALARPVFQNWGLKDGTDLANMLEALGRLGAVKWSDASELATYRGLGALLPELNLDQTHTVPNPAPDLHQPGRNSGDAAQP